MKQTICISSYFLQFTVSIKRIHRFVLIGLFALFITLFYSCVEEYKFEGNNEFSQKLVVEAFISNKNETQTITLSYSTSPTNKYFNPIENYAVIVNDTWGNTYVFQSKNNRTGEYVGTVPTSAFNEENEFQLYIQSDEGKEYYSDFVEFTPYAEVGDVHFEQQKLATSDPDEFTYGLQFYTNFKGDSNSGKFYKFEIAETWEYHSSWPILKYFDLDDSLHVGPLDYSQFICYKTTNISDIFLLSTNGLSENKYDNFELNFTSDQTQRLMFKYSLLVNQFSISYAEYLFWLNVKENSQESGGLFDAQPTSVPGNIYNINDDSEVVLGFFGVRGFTTKRVVLNGIDNLPYESTYFCTASRPGLTGWPSQRPLYLVDGKDNLGFFLGWAPKECFFCTLKGGSTTMPNFMEIDSLLINK